jgi:uracil-DNA glycosylase
MIINKNPILIPLPGEKRNFAIGKAKLIDKSKHKIFTTVHPSPLSASNGFFGSGVFANINTYLESKQIEPVNWKL